MRAPLFWLSTTLIAGPALWVGIPLLAPARADRSGSASTRAPVRPVPPSSPGLEPLADVAPGLSFDLRALSLGRVEAGTRRSFEVPWRRTGPGALGVLAVRAGCGCLEVGALPRVIGAGASGMLTAALRAPARPGPFRVGVHVVTDVPPPGRAVFRAEVEGYVERPLAARPTVVDLGPRRPGVRARADVLLVATRAAAGTAPAVALEGIAGTATLSEPVVRAGSGWRLRIEVVVPERPGAFWGSVRVDGAVSFRVPVRGDVVDGPVAGGPAGGLAADPAADPGAEERPGSGVAPSGPAAGGPAPRDRAVR